MSDTPPTMGTLTPEEFRRVGEIFEAALTKPVGERRAFVDEACRDNPLLLSQVERILDADERGNSVRRAAHRGNRTSKPSSCRSCGAALAAGHRFCPSCGTPIAAPDEEGRFKWQVIEH